MKEVETMDLNKFFADLKGGPSVLFLGQNTLKLETGQDLFLTSVLRKYATDIIPSTYEQLLYSSAHQSGEAALAWMHQQCERLSPPDWLDQVANFSWSCLYTSAIDAIWFQAFRSDWREMSPIFEETVKPIDPRNRSNLHCTYLFGCVNQSDDLKRPPLKKMEFPKRKQTAIGLAKRIPEIVTPFGLFLIEGYAGEEDWFSPADLYPIVDELNPGQAFLFSVTEKLAQNDWIQDLIEKKKLTIFKESLAQIIHRGEDNGLIKLNEMQLNSDLGRIVRIAGEDKIIPNELWNRVSHSASILEQNLWYHPNVSEDRRYYEFRDFLSESTAKPLWSGYSRGFAFKRKFQYELRKAVERSLTSNDLSDEPIILHGQTGTGKTIALGLLAFEVCKDGKYPVLFIERRLQKPGFSDIDTFCEWAQKNGASFSLIIWDGMMEYDQYKDLVNYLRSRGRKAVVIGSTYKQKQTIPSKKRRFFIEAPMTLSAEEVQKLSDFLIKIEPSLETLLHKETNLDHEFLVFLYRLLPPTRAQIKTGIVKEVDYAENRLLTNIREESFNGFRDNLMVHALSLAGLIKVEDAITEGSREIGGQDTTFFQELMGLLMVPGRFGLRLPFELLLHALNKDGYSNLINLLKRDDLFRWFEDTQGNILIGPRHSLEAELYVKSELGGVKFEIVYINQLLSNITDNDEPYGNIEIQFAVDLIRYIRNTNLFSEYYKDMADNLKELRINRSIINPRLMLQEATLLRVYGRTLSNSGNSSTEVDDVLDDAESILRGALARAESNGNNEIRYILLVELASLLGTKIRHLLENRKQEVQSIFPVFQEAKKYLLEVNKLRPENIIPLDVVAWIYLDLLKYGVIDDNTRAELEADVLYIFEAAELENHEFANSEEFQSCRMKLGIHLNRTLIDDIAFQKLVSQGSTAGYYLRTLNIVDEMPRVGPISEAELRRCEHAFNYLVEFREKIATDGRCLWLLLKLWWLVKSYNPLFFGEKQTVPFSQEDWRYCLSIITDIKTYAESLYTTLSLNYLHALCSFHLGIYRQSIEMFRELESESDYGRVPGRTKKRYLASNGDGTPRVFNGIVKSTPRYSRKGELYTEEIRTYINFYPTEFNRPTIQMNESLKFAIAFNFIGPIAVPNTESKS